jgi:FkbM family methyltransferase
MNRVIRSVVTSVVPEEYLRDLYQRYTRRTFRSYVKPVDAEGVQFEFFVGDPTGKDWYDKGKYGFISKEMLFIRDKLIKPGDVIFDCGAHHGFVAILFSKWTGAKGKVIAFEPVVRNREIIKRNLELNAIQNTILVEKALGSGSGEVSMSRSSNARVVDASPRTNKCEMTNLDEYTDLNPDFILIDVEGYEVEVLKGAKRLLESMPKFVIEIHTNLLKDPSKDIAEIFSLIDLEKYRLWIQWNTDEDPMEYDGNRAIKTPVHLFGVPRLARS